MCSYSEEDQTLCVRVKDNGRGLSEEGMARLFHPFQQAEGEATKRDFGGTGLGLVICRDILQAMGGGLTVASKGLGLGCTFTATMRVVDLSQTELGGAVSQAIVQAGSSRRASTRALQRESSVAARLAAAPLSANDSHLAFSPEFSPSGPTLGEADRPSGRQGFSHVSLSVELPAGGAEGADAASLRGVDTGNDASNGRSSSNGARSSLSSRKPASLDAGGRSKPERKSTHNGPSTAFPTLSEEEVVSAVASSYVRVRAIVAEDDRASICFPLISGSAVTLQAQHWLGRAPGGKVPHCLHTSFRVCTVAELVRRVLKMTLRLAGLDATIVEDGVAVTNILAQDPESVDIILLDANMVRVAVPNPLTAEEEEKFERRRLVRWIITPRPDVRGVRSTLHAGRRRTRRRADHAAPLGPLRRLQRSHAAGGRAVGRDRPGNESGIRGRGRHAGAHQASVVGPAQGARADGARPAAASRAADGDGAAAGGGLLREWRRRRESGAAGIE